jgi:inner membrane protein
MDPVTHLLSGTVLSGSISASKRWGRAAATVLIVGAIIPDIDHFPISWFFGGWEGYLKYHRGITHSLFGSVPLALMLAVIVRAIFGRGGRVVGVSLTRLMSLALLTIWLHIFFDLITSFGTMILYPFSTERYSLDLVFIIDLYVTAILLIPLLIGYFFKKYRVTLARLSILLVCIYFVMAGVNSYRALEEARANRPSDILTIDVIKETAYPGPFSPFNWMVITEGNDAFYLQRDVLRGGELERFVKASTDQYIAVLMEEPEVQTYMWFAEFPWITSHADESGHSVEFFDLRFYSMPERRPFLLKARFNADSELTNISMD